MKHLVSLSGGIGSWGAGMRAAEVSDPDDLRLVFTDTLIEDRDLYRFLIEGAAEILGRPRSEAGSVMDVVKAIPKVTEANMEFRKILLEELRQMVTEMWPRFVWLCDGRTPMEVFFDEGFLGNTRADPCSRVLKRDLYRSWLSDEFEPGECITYLGLDWTEIHRIEAFERNWDPWDVTAPLCEPPYLSKHDLKDWASDLAIDPPRLYAMGFGHNNCSGGCVKAGHGQWALLLRKRPEVYAYWEDAEERFRQETGHDVSILRDRRDIGDGGQVKPFTLTQLRDRVSCGEQIDMLDMGGCGCFTDISPEEA